MPLTVVEEINYSALSMQVASAAVEDGDWQMARDALSEACMRAVRALHEVDSLSAKQLGAQQPIVRLADTLAHRTSVI